MANFPVQPHELSAAWLTDRLREAGVLSSDRAVKGFTSNSIGDGVGLLGLVVRLELEYDDGPGRRARRHSW